MVKKSSSMAPQAEISPSCITSILSTPEGAAVKTAVLNWLKGVFTVTHITDCLNATGEKLEDGLVGHGKCNEGKSTHLPAHSKKTSKSKTGSNHPTKDTPVEKSPDAKSYSIDFPSKFDENATAKPTTGMTNWKLAKRTTVGERWKK